jgi:hypothetical protein
MFLEDMLSVDMIQDGDENIIFHYRKYLVKNKKKSSPSWF